MLATPGKLASWKGWLYELKYDGFRCLISKHRNLVRLESRSGRDMSECFPELVEEIRPIRQNFVADAELVVLDEHGRPVWGRLKARHVIRKPERIRQAAAADPAALFAFDLLWLNGADFRARPLLERKAALHRLLPCEPSHPIRRALSGFGQGTLGARQRARAGGHRRERSRLDLHGWPHLAVAEDKDRRLARAAERSRRP